LSQTYPNADDEKCPVQAHLELKKLADFDEKPPSRKNVVSRALLWAQLRTYELEKIRLFGAFCQIT
jgi:hypothetical protein